MSELTKESKAVVDISVNNIEEVLRYFTPEDQLALRKYVIGRLVDGANVHEPEESDQDDYVPTEYKRYISVNHDQDLQTRASSWIATVTYPGSTKEARIYWNSSSMKELIDDVFNFTPEFIYE